MGGAYESWLQVVGGQIRRRDDWTTSPGPEGVAQLGANHGDDDSVGSSLELPSLMDYCSCSGVLWSESLLLMYIR